MTPDGGNPRNPPTFAGAQARARDSQGGEPPASDRRNGPGNADATLSLADLRDLERLERRARGEPTLPIRAELEGLTDDEQHALIVACARRAVEWNRARTPRRRRADPPPLELVAPELGDERRPPGNVPGRTCAWCGRRRCAEHAGLDRVFQQAAGG